MLDTLNTAILAGASHWNGGAWHGPGWWFILIPIFWIALFVFLFGFLGRRRWAHYRAQEGQRTAESVLGERFARGEIDETEYRQRLEVLSPKRK